MSYQMLSLDVGWEVSLYFPAHFYVFVVQWGAPFHSLVHHFLYEELPPFKWGIQHFQTHRYR